MLVCPGCCFLWTYVLPLLKAHHNHTCLHNIMLCVLPTSARCFTCINQIPLHTWLFALLSSMHACYIVKSEVKWCYFMSAMLLPYLFSFLSWSKGQTLNICYMLWTVIAHLNMAAMRHTHTSYPPSKSNKFSASSATDTFNCEYLRSEIYVLCSEVKSLTEIITILNRELKNDRPKNDVIMSTPCDSCAQMDNKLTFRNLASHIWDGCKITL